MFKPKREKLAVTVTPEKTNQDKTFVQIEGELTQEQLEAIAAGIGCPIEECGTNHNETMVSAAQLNC